MTGGAGGHFFERAVIDIDANGAGAFGGDQPVDHHAVLIAARIIGAITALCAGGTPADIDARHRHARRLRQDGPHVASTGNRGQFFGVVVGRRPGGRHIDHRRCPGHRHRFLQSGDCHRDVERRREPERHANTLAQDVGESGKLVADHVGSRRNAGEAIVALGIGGGNLGTLHLRGRDRHCDAWQHTVGTVDDPPVNRSGRRAHALAQRCHWQQ